MKMSCFAVDIIYNQVSPVTIMFCGSQKRKYIVLFIHFDSFFLGGSDFLALEYQKELMNFFFFF